MRDKLAALYTHKLSNLLWLPVGELSEAPDTYQIWGANADSVWADAGDTLGLWNGREWRYFSNPAGDVPITADVDCGDDRALALA